MKKHLFFSLLATTVFATIAPLNVTAKPLQSTEQDAPQESGFWSSLITGLISAFSTTSLDSANCEIYHEDGYLYVNRWANNHDPYTSYTPTSIHCSDGGYVYFQENAYHRPAPSPFGTLTLTSYDEIYVQKNGPYKNQLILNRAGTISPVKAIYASGNNVYIDIKESFGTNDAHEFIYLNNDMVSFENGRLYVELNYKGVSFTFSPPCICLDNDQMYVSIHDNGLYLDAFGDLCAKYILPLITPQNLCYTAYDNEIIALKHSLGIYQNGSYITPRTIYSADGVFLFD
ncbi:hypothetical protein COB21_05705 [Candidatus Aerophobetes bacterium]|uniref:Uncharacterized protein n=1 Tax=Aerophobetes bacterium TaxID=2030807 RepID=A0A2A4WYM3_UNCAE|nr:MAG: hypothetical protein COB21_05705 [Candidatus Aerophobetes bacterium]